MARLRHGEGGLLALYKYNAVNNVDPCIQTAIQTSIDSESISPTGMYSTVRCFGATYIFSCMFLKTICVSQTLAFARRIPSGLFQFLLHHLVVNQCLLHQWQHDKIKNKICEKLKLKENIATYT